MASSIRDCYIDWPPKQVIQLAEDFHQRYLKQVTIQ
jgi:hypothetical protein